MTDGWDFAMWYVYVCVFYCIFNCSLSLGVSTGGCGDEGLSCAAGICVNFHGMGETLSKNLFHFHVEASLSAK